MSDPGNTLATAQLIAINAGSQTYSDAVSTADPDDYYRFTLSGRSSINLTLTGLSGNADLQVLNGAGTVLQQSTNPGTAAEDVNLTDLSAGVYYVRVFAASGTTNAPYTFTRQAINNAQTDILWRNYSTGQNTAWAMNGTTRVSSTDLKPISDVNWRLEGSADFSGDGQADLVWRNYSTGQNVIWLMNGTTSLSEVNLQAVGTNWHISGTGDFNSDGKTDLVWRNYSTGEDVVWLLNGTTFSTTVNLQAVGDPSWQINGTGDFNNDGQTDLLWRRYDGTGETVVWFMNGTTFSTAVNLQAVGDPNWRISGTGDFNHDGQTDILWRRYSTGEDVIWLMNGTTLLSNGGVYFNPIGDLNWQIAASFVHYGDPGSLDTAGNTPATAFDVGTLTGQATYTGTVNGSDVNDYYRFTLSTAAPNFTLALKGLSGDANLQLLDGSSNTLQTASNSGTTAELMQRALTAGTYYLRVFPATSSVSANYTLSTVFDAAPPTVTVALVNDTALNGTNTDRRTADPTISVQLSTERPLGHLRAGFNNTLVANYTDIAVPLQAGSVTLTPAQLQAINGGLPLTDGSYVLHLRATGVEDVLVTTTDFTLTLDRTTAAPSNLQLTAGSDSGQSASDNVTNVTTPTVTGTAEAGALIQLYSQGQVIGQGTAAGNGVWQITVQPLVAGTTTLTAIATDVAGNVSAASTVLSLVVDTQAPSAPSFLPLDSTADTGESHSDGITRNPTPTLTGHAEAGTNITLWNNAQVVGQTRTDASGFWQLTTLSLPQGLATLRATATDQAGNVSAASTPLLLTVDTVAPAAPGNVRFAAGIDKGRSSTDGQTNVNTPIVTGTAAPHTLVQLWGEGQLLGQQTSDANGNWQIQTPTLADGGYYLSAFALDLAGNRSLASPALALIIDTQAPTAPTLLPLSAISDTGSSASDGVTANPTPTVVGQSAAYALVQLLDQGQVIGQMIADETGAWQITAPTLTEGAHTFTTTATDVAGNVSVNSAPLSLTIDTALPTLTVTTPLTTPLGSSTRLAGTVAGTGSAIVSASYHFDDRPAIALAFDPATGTFDQALDLTGITSDTHTLTLTTTDTAGNIKTLQPTVTVALGSAPVITAALAQDTAPGGLTNDDGVTSNPTISGQVTNAPAVLRAGFGTGASVTYGDITAQLQPDGSFTLNRAQLETLYGGTLVDAHYTLSLQATDAAGNVTTPLAITFDLDTQAPTAPTNLSLTPAGMYAVAITGNAAAGAQVQLFEGTTLIGEALANAAGSWRVTTSQLRNGTHSLTATASDVAGNTSPATTETTFTVETLVPSVPQGLRLTALTDSGQSQTDNITNNATPTIVGTTEAGATVRLFRAQQLLGETVADITTGAWSIALTTALPEGEQSLSVVAHNAIGDSQTATLLTTIDTVAPTTTQLSVLATGSTTATALANGVTLTTGTRLLGQVHGTTSAVASLQYQLGTNPAVTVPVAANGLFNYRLAFTGSNSGDNQTLSVTLTDVAGNTTTLAPFLVNVSATNDGGGEAPVLVAQLLQDTGSDASDGWTYIPGIAGVASAPGVITALLATFDTATNAVFQDLSSLLQPDGTFALDEETLAALAGGDLADGAYTLRLRVQADTNQIAEQVVNFTLDRTAPVTTLPNLIDGIAWERGTHLQGTVVEASENVNVTYQLETVNGVAVGSSRTLPVTDQAFDQVLNTATLTEETPYNLVLTSTDRAGNTQRSGFQFFIPSDRKVTDNDTLPNQPSDADPMPSGAATSEDIGSWGSVGSGGGWGGWSGPLGGGGSGGSGGGMFTPTMVAGNPVGLAAEPQPASVPAPLAGSGYEYAESIERIVGAAVNFISVSPETLTKKAALYNRESLLRALGRQVQRLIYSDGNFANDQSLVERLRPVLAGLFADAYDPRAKGVDTEGRQIDRAGVEHAFAPLGAAWLAQSLLSEPLAGLSVREQVFQATLLAVVTEATPGVTNVAQQQALAAAVMALAKTYAWLNPNPEATVPVADKDFGFLDALWRLQIPDANGQFKGSGDIAQTLEDSVMALERLLEGVEDKVRAIQFLNNLVQAASNVTSLKADVKDATFLRELVEFGVEFVKTNPTVNATATDTAVQGFLDRLWRGDTQQVKQAQ